MAPQQAEDHRQAQAQHGVEMDGWRQPEENEPDKQQRCNNHVLQGCVSPCRHPAEQDADGRKAYFADCIKAT
ncbi:MAG: hypothetical protein B7X56_05150 [Burkholderiales bacterium 34-67-9]|nr:MAG: hypothetical protein B7X56_05150 [Burkholderiales bacterium 34-67-9]